jgi:lysophospholipase L1-like esterase
MVLGDSLTFGTGLAVEERYTAIAEKLLNKNFNNMKFEILNFGIDSGPTTKERDVLRKLKGVVDPDLIVVGFCLNDPQPKSQNYSIEREKLRKSIIGSIIDRISRFMLYIGQPYIGKLINNAFYKSAKILGLIPTWQNALQRTYDPSSSEWQEFIQALKDIKSISDELNLPSPIFAILNQGTFTDKPTDYSNPDENLKQFLQWYHQAEKAAEDIGFISYNHEYEISRQLRNEPLAVNILDGHPSANLNRIYGEKLYQKILEQITQYQ